MFAGHFGLAAAVKAARPRTPLWALMAATQLLDIVFVPLFVGGIETIDDSHGTSYGDAVIHADYTHALAGALLMSLLAGWLAGRRWGRTTGATIGAVVFSHWLLDLLVHRADLPLLPGNAGGFPLLGLGLWAHPAASMAAELVLVLAGGLLYARSLWKTAGQKSGRAAARYAAIGVMGLLLVMSLISDVMGWGA